MLNKISNTDYNFLGMDHRLFQLIIVFMMLYLPGEGYVSGFQISGINSDSYYLRVMGGMSSWDYESLREKDKLLADVLDELRSDLDKVFQETVTQYNIKISRFSEIKKYPNYVDGVLIENDLQMESSSHSHFTTYINFKQQPVAEAFVEVEIPNTSFNAKLTVLVKERTRRDHLELVLTKMIERLQQSVRFNACLY